MANEEIVKLNTMVESSQVKYSHKVKTFQQQIEDIAKKNEQDLMDKDKLMASELDTVHEKVTQMVRTKNAELERANKRADEAEVKAKAAELLLKQLEEGFARAHK